MRVILNGACGRMGRAVGQLLSEGKRGMELAVGVDLRAEENDPGTVKTLGEYRGEADVLIDFSHHSCVGALLDYAVSRGLPCVIATTGHTEEEKAEIAAAAEKIPLFLSANMSMGVAVLASFAKTAAALLPDADVEIVEAHHNQKLDAPSGTALMLASAVKEARTDAAFVCGRSGHHKREKKEIGIHALRMGNLIGEHKVILTTGEESITLEHTAYSRTLFADGAPCGGGVFAGQARRALRYEFYCGREVIRLEDPLYQNGTAAETIISM